MALRCIAARLSTTTLRWVVAGGLLGVWACGEREAEPTGPDDGVPGPPGEVIPEPPVEPDFPPLPGLVLQAPVRLQLTHEKRLLVSDYAARAVFLVDPASRQAVGGFRVEGRPLAVGWWGRRVFVGNATTRTVDVFDHRGAYQYSFGNGPGAVGDPKDLAIDDTLGLVFVVDGRSKVVRVFNVYGEPGKPIAGPGAGADRLQNPTGIALHDGQLFVSDYGDLRTGDPARIKIFDYDGGLVASLSGGNGGSRVRFARPQGLTVDAQGNVFLTEAMSGEVIVLDPEADVVRKTLGTWGSAPGQLRLPLDVVVMPGPKDVFVASFRNGRVEPFVGGGVLP